MMTPLDPRVFRAYDIRGHAETQMSPDFCRLVAQGYAAELRERTKKEHPTVCVGRDCRLTSPAFEAAAIAGLVAGGCRVLHMGMTPSPVNYFTICHQHLDGGLQVTASHNPGHDNGLKLSMAHAHGFAGEKIQELLARLQRGDVPTVAGGSVEEVDALTPYKTWLLEQFAEVGRGHGIAIDGGNGVAGPFYSDVLMAAGAAVTGLYLEPDGTFPNHPADPSKRDTLRDLQLKVREEQLDVGFAYDGDGDRLGVVDEEGQIRNADELILLFARDALQRFPGAGVVYTVCASGTLEPEVRRLGGTPVMCRVGHTNVHHAMETHRGVVGGELSGHFYFGQDAFGYDDPLLASLRLLRILQQSQLPLSTLLSDFPKVYQAQERRPHCDDDRKATVVQHAVAHFQSLFPVETLDGARVDCGEGGLIVIRQSNTSPCLTISIEARSPERLQELETLVQDYFQTHHQLTI
jgi:phosphomannomutase/phosphoglucomutase